MHALQPRRVVVTGVGVVSSLATSARETWRKLLAGETGIRVAGNLDPAKHKSLVRADVIDDDIPQRFLKGKELRNSSRYTRMAIEAAGEAMMDAGLLNDDLSPILDLRAAGVAAGTAGDARRASGIVAVDGLSAAGQHFAAGAAAGGHLTREARLRQVG